MCLHLITVLALAEDVPASENYRQDSLLLSLLISLVAGRPLGWLLNLGGDALEALTNGKFDLFSEVQNYLQALEFNEFEKILVKAIATELMVMVTMDDEKVYVGWAYKTSDPSLPERKYFSLIPVISGYRNECRRVIFTTYYEEIYEGIEAEDNITVEEFVVILPVARLRSARLFDATSYDRFQASPTSAAYEASNEPPDLSDAQDK